MNDRKLFFAAIGLIVLPLSLAFFGGDKFRSSKRKPNLRMLLLKLIIEKH